MSGLLLPLSYKGNLLPSGYAPLSKAYQAYVLLLNYGSIKKCRRVKIINQFQQLKIKMNLN